MNLRSLLKYVPPYGPVLSALLVGLVLLSAILYYRAVKIQRFLEPALALSQPRYEFSKNISRLFEDQFGSKSVRGLKLRAGSILIDQSLLFSREGLITSEARLTLQKLARVFKTLLDNEQSRSDVSLLLITARFTTRAPRGMLIERIKAQHMVALIQDALFTFEPGLGEHFEYYFATAVQPVNPFEGNKDMVEIKIIPSEFLHIKVLERLEKYSY
jgi:hypothetical protein